MNRPNPRVATAHVVAGLEISNEEAIERMRRQLSRAYLAGARDGWSNGVSDAMDDEPKFIPNPYEVVPS